MSNRVLIRLVLKSILPAVLILFLINSICLIVSLGQDYAIFQFFSRSHSSNIAFMVHVPVLLIFFVSLFSKVHNPLIIVRHRSFISLHVTDLRLTFFAASFYFVAKVIIETIMLLCIEGISFLQFMGFDYALVYLVQFGAILFSFLLYILLFEIFSNTAGASVVFFFIMGIDFLLSVFPLFGNNPINLHLFITPMNLMPVYVDRFFNLTASFFIPLGLELLFMLVKVIVTGALPFLIILMRRRDLNHEEA